MREEDNLVVECAKRDVLQLGGYFSMKTMA